MNTKNQATIRKPSPKEINAIINLISPQKHTQEQYMTLLNNKQKTEDNSTFQSEEQILSILNPKIKTQPNNQSSSLCNCCYEQVNRHKYWCRVCGNKTCKKCLSRQREDRNNIKYMSCEKCEDQYLKTRDQADFKNKYQAQILCFQKLARQYQDLEELVADEKSHLMDDKYTEKNYKKQLILLVDSKNQLDQQNKIIESQITEMNKKLQFGNSIKNKLKKKLHQLRKLQKESFGSISNADSQKEYDAVNELDISHQNLNQSLLTSMLQKENMENNLYNSEKQKCKCEVY